MATVSCHHALASLDGAIRQGFSGPKLLKAAGINPALLELPQARINDDQMTSLVQHIWATLGDEFMGFTVTPCKRGSFAFMLHTVCRCYSLREALITGLRFYQLCTEDIETTLTEENERATINISFRHPVKDEKSFYQEFWMVIWHRLASWLCGISIPLIETRFAQPKPMHAIELMTMFPSAHYFNAGDNALVFPAEYLNCSLIRNRSEVNDFLIRSPYNLLTIPGHDRSLRSKVEQLLRDAESLKYGFPRISVVADRLYMTQQTLHRRLKVEGSSFQRIKDGIRRDAALALLTQEGRPVFEVAEQVGFSDARSFTRAFKHWTGMSPREYRRFMD
jgi:AraC-like DNA-binding protein